MNKSDVLKRYGECGFFKNEELVRVDLSHIQLAKVDFSEANLQFAEFNDSKECYIFFSIGISFYPSFDFYSFKGQIIILSVSVFNGLMGIYFKRL